MTHKIYSFADNILTFGFIGTIDAETITLFSRDVSQYLEQGSKENPINFLVDTRTDDGMSFYARRWFTQLNNDERLDKVALIGEDNPTRVIVTFILRATGRNNIRFVSSEEEGIEWIKNS